MESLRSEEDPNIDKVTLYANQEVIRDAIEILNRGRVCIECQQLFTYRESLGKFQCKKHIDYKQGNVCLPVKTFDSISERFQWSCCGRYDMRVVYTPNNDVFQSFYTNIARVPFSTGSRRFYDKPIGHLPVAPGCIPCDHRISDDLSEIVINDIAAILPYLDGDLLTLPGFDKDEMIIHRYDLNQVRLQKLKQSFDIDIWDKLSDEYKQKYIREFDIYKQSFDKDIFDSLSDEYKQKFYMLKLKQSFDIDIWDKLSDEYKKKYIREFDGDELDEHVCEYYKRLSEEEQNKLNVSDCFDDSREQPKS